MIAQPLNCYFDVGYVVRGKALGFTLIVMCLLVWFSDNDSSYTLGAEIEHTKQFKPFVNPDSLDHRIPTPDSVIGHRIGDGAVRYEPAVRYLHALAESSDRVTLTSYAKSHEGRPLYYLTITSKSNHGKLDSIRQANAKLADPRTLSDPSEAQRILNTLPGVAWLAYSIHGDELSSTDAALQVAYQLAAGKDLQTQRMREELVIHIDPMMNPDGRERYLSQLQQLVGKVPNSDYQSMQHRGLWSAGRGNHYLFDLNRDWLMHVHPETRGRAVVMGQWNPHLVVDSHEMGSLDTYLFEPPREPLNTNLSGSVMSWRRNFSKDQAGAFDQHGWSYYTREWYEEWYPGYTNAWSSLRGAIGMLYEQAGVNGAAIKQRAGDTLTYRDAVHHHVVSSLANLESLRANKRKLIEDFYEDRLWAVSSQRSGHEVFLLPPGTDQEKMKRFTNLLKRQGVEIGFAAAPFHAFAVKDVAGHLDERKRFDSGTMVVRAAQPLRRLLLSMLEFDPRMSDAFLKDERRDLENHRGTRAYDITAWNIPMAYGLNAYWANSAEEVVVKDSYTQTAGNSDTVGSYGFVIDGRSGDVYQAMVRLMEQGYKLRVAKKTFTIHGNKFEPGAVLLRRHENSKTMPDQLQLLTSQIDIEVWNLDTALSEDGPDLGGQRFTLLEKPRIAIASQWPISTTSFGAVWHLLDERIGMRVSPINLQFISRVDLRSYNVLVLPNTWSGQALSAIFSDGVKTKIKQWMQSGGTLIALGQSATFFAGKDRKMSKVKLKRDVLDKLDIYKEAVQREQQAMHVSIDPVKVWGDDPSSLVQPSKDSSDQKGAESKDKKSDAKKNLESLKRGDAWERLFSPQGSIVATNVNPEHWLTFGVGGLADAGDDPDVAYRNLPVLLSGSYALMAKYPVQMPVRFRSKDELRLSGLLWPEARKRFEHTAYTTVERVGRGQLILFVADPFFRGYFEGSGRLLLNAMLLGPGMGTNQPVPW